MANIQEVAAQLTAAEATTEQGSEAVGNFQDTLGKAEIALHGAIEQITMGMKGVEATLDLINGSARFMDKAVDTFEEGAALYATTLKGSDIPLAETIQNNSNTLAADAGAVRTLATLLAKVCQSSQTQLFMVCNVELPKVRAEITDVKNVATNELRSRAQRIGENSKTYKKKLFEV